MSVDELTSTIIRAAMKVHTALGPGLLESAYEACLCHELRKQGLKADRQVVLPIQYDGIQVDEGYKIDLLINDLVILELKTVEKVLPVHTAQIISYLRLSGLSVGLILNFKQEQMRDGIHRYVNNHRPNH